jgi:acetyl-CoA carboxylase carboxyltransferase component
LRKIIEFTQSGGLIHIIIDGVNVGAQSYFNAESTMLMHTKGVLIMTGRGSMVLTGKRALDFSGGVSAEDEGGIGGYERIMGPNGQAQYLARDLADAFRILLEYHRYAYIRPGETRVRPSVSTDPDDRDAMEDPYPEKEEGTFERVGDIFSAEHNPDRKKPFDMRTVMSSVIDRDGGFLERFRGMTKADTSIVWDCHVGGEAVSLIGFESRPIARQGYVPGDGPDTWTGGTLFPASSKKVARAINAASGNRPVVVLANLSGFDGSPESMRWLQLEYGAEIGRAVVNFKGPIHFCVVGRYHGGAYVVFSKALNSGLRAVALEGSFASVIGGAPAAAVVFPRLVRARTERDSRVVEARKRVGLADADEQPRLREEAARVKVVVNAEMQGEVAREFDSIHSVYRACEVGSLDDVIPPSSLRAHLISSLRDDGQPDSCEDDTSGSSDEPPSSK